MRPNPHPRVAKFLGVETYRNAWIEFSIVDENVILTMFTSLIRLNPEKATTEGVTPRPAALGEAGTRPAEKKGP